MECPRRIPAPGGLHVGLQMFVIFVSIVAGGMLGLFGLGFLSRRANRAGAYVGIVVCGVS